MTHVHTNFSTCINRDFYNKFPEKKLNGVHPCQYREKDQDMNFKFC